MEKMEKTFAEKVASSILDGEYGDGPIALVAMKVLNAINWGVLRPENDDERNEVDGVLNAIRERAIEAQRSIRNRRN